MSPSTLTSFDVKTLLRAVDALLTNAVGILQDNVSDASVHELLCRQDDLRMQVQLCLDSKASSWSELVLATRTLDRTLALMAAISADVSTSGGHSRKRMFVGAIYSGAVMLPRLLKVLEDYASTHSARNLHFYTSGAVVSLAQSGSVTPSELYLDGLKDKQYRQAILAGVGGDCFDLMDDLSGHLPHGHSAPLMRTLALLDLWKDYFDACDVAVTRRAEWGAGLVMSASEVASLWGVDDTAVLAAAKRYEILGVPLWDGTIAFPDMQFEKATGRPIDGLAELLGKVNFDAVSPWSLAIWLGQARPGISKRIDKLANDRGRMELLAELADVGVVPRVDATVAVPSVSAFHGLVANGSPGPSTLFRVSRIGFSPYFFSSADGSDESSRFDLKAPNGTLYTAKTANGAFNEVFSRMLIVDVQEILSRMVWKFDVRGHDGRLVNLMNGGVERRSIPDPQNVLMSRNRVSTQMFAQNSYDAGYGGVLHPLHSDNSEVGVALFGLAGARAPEACGLGLWAATHDRLSSNARFWTWFSTRIRNGSFQALYNQLPLVPLF